ncbi:MAG: acyl-ACP--UDP-N-acetylglucosamine O-acyltransferase [Phycisphaerales bacterium]|nr:acyl-ACP--UDP-N-acetylglucosamine O-acyltransferase [Phycisphaerales bacterium]MCI0630108.1 acyl-ACP--UDP-N-acetylglucosamine O-acyltransferase [Phycisphaerales bacterium]MCI0674380.1 acyl-ACP--UDP-N-acetylglucosamine O-acyltransferase [Phycisphaerales bacterium]
MATVHDTAIIDPTAHLADDVLVGPYCVIGPDVEIGEGTVLHNHVAIQSLTSIGRENVFYPFSVIGADPQDRKFHGERTRLKIGDRNKIREHVTIHRGTGNGGGLTRVGNDNLIMVAVHIAHDCILGNDICIANQVMLAGHVRIEDGANIGGGAGLHHFTTVGSCAFVGGLARITKDVPPFMIVEGNPAEVRAINWIAMTRRGYSADHIDAVKDAYKRLYRDNGAPMSDKIVELKREYHDVPAVLQLCEALVAAAQGVHGRAAETRRADDKRNGQSDYAA